MLSGDHELIIVVFICLFHGAGFALKHAVDGSADRSRKMEKTTCAQLKIVYLTKCSEK